MPPSRTGSDAPDPRLPGQGHRARGQHASHDHRRVRRALAVLAGSVAALLVLGVGAGAVAFYRLQSNIDAQSIDGLLGNDRPTDEPVDPTTGNSAVNILVLGSDTRALADGTGDEYGGEAADPGARSDSTILVHLSADRRSAAIISIPRDSMVEIPACTTNENKTIAAHLGMFNSAYSEAGAACSVKTVEQLTQVRIDHYAVVDFSGFQQMVDALGGVTICTPEAINDTKANLHLTAGTHADVNGATALAYARVRYTVGDGSDISRIGRQQALMSSIFQKVTSAGVLTRPDKLYSFLDAATKSVTADPELANLSDSLQLAQSLQKLPASGVKFITVPTEPYPKNTARVQWTDAADALWQEVREDTLGANATPTTTTTASPDDSSALSVAPANVAVNVVNVGAPAGTAATMAEQLRAVGFDVKSTGDGRATQPGQAAVVRFGSSRADSARTLAAALPSAKLIEDKTLGSSITLEVSQANISVTDVRSRVTATSTPTPSATITSRVATDDICA